MPERAYTVHELDALRRVVENKWLFGYYGNRYTTHDQISRSYREDERATSVEQMVRTHMLAGHTAEDLVASERPDPALATPENGG